MKLIAENIDFYPETLIDVVDIVNELIHKEDRNFDDVKRIKNIMLKRKIYPICLRICKKNCTFAG